MLALRDVTVDSPRLPPDLFATLRETTALAHRRLEQDLDLLRPPLSKQRFAEILQRFLAFHLGWEPSLARVPALARLAEPRSRIPHLHRDLANLGLDPQAVTPSPAAGRLARDLESATGSLYVLEGSTLGGKHISAALAAAPWLPADGLTYFNPYGDHTGVLWNAFKDEARALCGPDAAPAVVAGAHATFDLLRAELVPGLPA